MFYDPLSVFQGKHFNSFLNASLPKNKTFKAIWFLYVHVDDKKMYRKTHWKFYMVKINIPFQHGN